MRTIARRATLFAAIFALVLAALDWRLGANVFTSYALGYRALTAAVGAPPDEVLLLGTSHVARGVDPTQLGAPAERAFNFALDAAPPSFFVDWYTRLYRKYRPAPKRVVIDAASFIFDGQRLYRRYAHDSEYFPADHFWRELEAGEVSRELLIKHRWPLLKYRRNYSLLLRHENLNMDSLDRYSFGWMPLVGTNPHHDRVQYPPTHIEETEVRALERLLEVLASDRVEVVLVQTPVYLPKFPLDDATTRRIAAIAAARGIPFLNYNAERRSDLNSELQHFHDYGHLNVDGGKIFSARLGVDLHRLRLGGLRAERTGNRD
ncbi:MAG: hypothetical protein ACKVX7_19680 [Planctomycetota bacterium]